MIGHVLFVAVLMRAFWQDAVLGLLVLTCCLIVAIPLAIAQIQYYRGLVDEVDDHGDHLAFRAGGLRQDVFLEDVIGVTIGMDLGVRIIVESERPGPLGTRLTFLPRSILSVNAARMAADLQARAQEARQAHDGRTD